MSAGVYKIVNKENGFMYIGSSLDAKKRWWNHKYNLNNNKHVNSLLQKAWNKYGEESFQCEALQRIDDLESDESTNLLLQKIEQVYLDIYKPEYNITYSAKTGSRSKEARKKNSEKHKGENNPIYGVDRKGEKQINSKLTKEDVREIKNLLKNTTLTHQEIADTFGVSRTSISEINNGRNWTHITIEGE